MLDVLAKILTRSLRSVRFVYGNLYGKWQYMNKEVGLANTGSNNTQQILRKLE